MASTRVLVFVCVLFLCRQTMYVRPATDLHYYAFLSAVLEKERNKKKKLKGATVFTFCPVCVCVSVLYVHARAFTRFLRTALFVVVHEDIKKNGRGHSARR